MFYHGITDFKRRYPDHKNRVDLFGVRNCENSIRPSKLMPDVYERPVAIAYCKHNIFDNNDDLVIIEFNSIRETPVIIDRDRDNLFTYVSDIIVKRDIDISTPIVTISSGSQYELNVLVSNREMNITPYADIDKTKLVSNDAEVCVMVYEPTIKANRCSVRSFTIPLVDFRRKSFYVPEYDIFITSSKDKLRMHKELSERSMYKVATGNYDNFNSSGLMGIQLSLSKHIEGVDRFSAYMNGSLCEIVPIIDEELEHDKVALIIDNCVVYEKAITQFDYIGDSYIFTVKSNVTNADMVFGFDISQKRLIDSVNKDVVVPESSTVVADLIDEIRELKSKLEQLTIKHEKEMMAKTEKTHKATIAAENEKKKAASAERKAEETARAARSQVTKNEEALSFTKVVGEGAKAIAAVITTVGIVGAFVGKAVSSLVKKQTTEKMVELASTKTGMIGGAIMATAGLAYVLWNKFGKRFFTNDAIPAT